MGQCAAWLIPFGVQGLSKRSILWYDRSESERRQAEGGERVQQVMWVLSSLAILGVVAVMAAFCLATLRPHPQRMRCWTMESIPHAAEKISWQENVFWLLGALAWLWGMVAVGYLLRSGSFDGFMDYFSYRFLRQGDASNYLYLAEHGYTAVGDERYYIVFYPLYPLLVRVLSVLTGSLEVAGVLLSHSCYALAVVLMRHLAAQSLPAEKARVATAAMLLYPYSFYCFGTYTESLFLLLAVGCLLQLRHERWWEAGVLAFLAALCRTQGLALCFACAYAYLSAPEEARGSWRGLLAAAGAAVGFAGYLALNWAVTGDPFRFMTYQRDVWFHQVKWFGTNLASQLGSALTHEDMSLTTFWPQIVLYFLGCGGLGLLFVRSRRSPEGVYSVAFLGMSYLSSWLISGGRYMYGCVGLYLALGCVKRHWLRVVLLTAEAALAVIFAWQYVSGAKMW